MIRLFSRPKAPPKRTTQATRDLTRHEREQRRLALRNAAHVAAMVEWLGTDYCLAQPVTLAKAETATRSN